MPRGRDQREPSVEKEHVSRKERKGRQNLIDFHVSHERKLVAEYEEKLKAADEKLQQAEKNLQQEQQQELDELNQKHHDAIRTREEELIRLKAEVSELKTSAESSIEKAVKDNDKYHDKYHEGKMEELKSEHKDYVTLLKETHQEEVRKCKKDHEIDVARLHKDKYRLRLEAEKVEQRHKTFITDLGDQHQKEAMKSRNDLAEQKRRHDQSITDAEDQHQKEVMKHRNDLAEQKRRHDESITALRKQHQEDFDRTDEEYQVVIAGLNTDLVQIKLHSEELTKAHRQELATVRDDHKEQFRLQTESHKQETSELIRRHKEEKTEMEADFATARKAMHTDFTAKSAGMKMDLTKLSAALMARDDDVYKAQTFNFSVKPLEDTNLKSTFLDLAKLVDDVGRFEWMSGQQLWPDHTLNRLSRAQALTVGMVKRYIVQDCVWTLLYKYIFCSPFRVFGSEGRALERQWTKSNELDNNQDPFDAHTQPLFTWPEPRFETERWRYFTVRECRTVLRQKLSGQDPRAGLKREFKNQTESLNKEIESNLSMIVDLDKTMRDRIGDLTMSAFKTWLEFGMQRCRIRIMMLAIELASTREKASQAREGSIELVARPSLGRHGNASGFQLTEYVTLKGCEGELVKLP